MIALVLFAALMTPGPGVGALWRANGHSMEPTIPDGAMLVVDQALPRISGYARGDVVILSPPGAVTPFPFETMVKRVIALPGEHVVVARGQVTVDGRVLDEPYLPPGRAEGGQAGPVVSVVVPDGEVFVMGDHRGASLDSRTFGSIPVDQLHGRVLVIVGSDGLELPGAPAAVPAGLASSPAWRSSP